MPGDPEHNGLGVAAGVLLDRRQAGSLRGVLNIRGIAKQVYCLDRIDA